MQDMTNRRTLKMLTALMIVIGIAMLIRTLFSSLAINAKQENSAWGTCSLSDFPVGEVTECNLVSVYRRTNKEIESIDMYTHLLADPYSDASVQPKNAKNKWRSESSEYFVFKPYAPKKGCAVKLKSPQDYGWSPPENEALVALPHFHELCEGRTWDTSGRLYRRSGALPELNLIVPAVEWVSPTTVRVHYK